MWCSVPSPTLFSRVARLAIEQAAPLPCSLPDDSPTSATHCCVTFSASDRVHASSRVWLRHGGGGGSGGVGGAPGQERWPAPVATQRGWSVCVWNCSLFWFLGLCVCVCVCAYWCLCEAMKGRRGSGCPWGDVLCPPPSRTRSLTCCRPLSLPLRLPLLPSPSSSFWWAPGRDGG